MVCTTLDITEVTELSSELLDRVWCRFLEWQGVTDVYTMRRHYKWVARRGLRSQEFETWLFTQGATVKQRSVTRYLQFTDEGQAMMFVLKHT